MENRKMITVRSSLRDEVEGLWGELANKVKLDDGLEWHNCEYVNGYYAAEVRFPLRYAKTSTGIVFLNGLFSKDDACVAAEVITTLPEGFRPKGTLTLPVGATNSELATGCIHISHMNGEISWAGRGGSQTGANNMCIDTCFFAGVDSPSELLVVPPTVEGELAQLRREVAELRAELSNKATLLRSTLELHVSKAGSDTTGDGTEAYPFLTIQKAVDTIGAFSSVNVHSCSISIHPGVYHETVWIRSLPCAVELYSTTRDKKDVVIEGVPEEDATFRVRLPYLTVARHITFRGTSSQARGVVGSFWGGNLILENCAVESDGEGIGVFCNANSRMCLTIVEISRCGQAVHAGAASNINAQTVSGSGNQIGYMANGGFIAIAGSNLTATTITSTLRGGQIWSDK